MKWGNLNGLMKSYNLRSLEKKRNNFHSENVPPEAYNPRVCLERLKLLECDNIENSRFYLQKGKIKVKENKSVFPKKILLRIFFLFTLLLTLVYWRDIQTRGITLVKKCADFHPSVHNYFDAVKFYKSIFNQFKYKAQKKAKEVEMPIAAVPKVNSTSLEDTMEIRQLVRDYFAEMKKKHLIPNTERSSQSFIEEQCKRDIEGGSYSVKKKVFNVTFHNMSRLADYALESEGAKILTVFNTEPYGTIALTYLNINLWAGLSDFLMKYFKCFNANGPNSILKPWKKPGDCWAFKGSQGRVQIKLSDEIVITAVTIEHVPKGFTFKGNIQSAPKKFSLLGVMESENKKIHLGSYEYEMSGQAAQTFFIQPKVGIPFRIVEVNFETNQGEKFTCVYKVRIHGDK